MVSKKSSLVISAIAVLSFIFSVAYISSCTKPLSEFPYSCNGIVCNNGGHCDSARCKCPVGYDGTHCENKTVEKFYGFWQIHSKVIGSDSAKYKKFDTTYTLQIAPTATNTTFFLYNFGGNPYYSEIVCLLDSVNKTYFTFDTTSAVNMLFDHYRIRGGWGGIFKRGNNTFYDSVWAIVNVRRLNSTVNWQNDTMTLTMKKL